MAHSRSDCVTAAMVREESDDSCLAAFICTSQGKMPTLLDGN